MPCECQAAPAINKAEEKAAAAAFCFILVSLSLRRRHRREAVAAAQGGNFEVEWGVFGVAAFIDQTVRSLMRSKDGHELFILLMSFTEVGTESTLSVMNRRHNDLPELTPSVCKV